MLSAGTRVVTEVFSQESVLQRYPLAARRYAGYNALEPAKVMRRSVLWPLPIQKW
jgi:hypothetical protein